MELQSQLTVCRFQRKRRSNDATLFNFFFFVLKEREFVSYKSLYTQPLRPFFKNFYWLLTNKKIKKRGLGDE